MTSEQFDALPISPQAKLIVEYGCRSSERNIHRNEVEKALRLSRVEVELAFRQLRTTNPSMGGVAAPGSQGAEICIPMTSPARALYATRSYVSLAREPVKATPAPAKKAGGAA